MNLFNKLSNNKVPYIHSNPNNFVQHSLVWLEGKKYANEINEAKESLKTTIINITNRCNDFYNELQIPAHDEFDPNTGNIILNGARVFEDIYLKKNEKLDLSDKDSLTTILLTLMNNITYKDIVERKINSGSVFEYDKFIQFYKNLTNKRQKDLQFIQAMKDTVGKEAYKLVSIGLENLFTNKRRSMSVKDTYAANKTIEAKMKDDEIFKEILKKYSLTKKSDIPKIKKEIEKHFFQKPSNKRDIAIIMWEALEEVDKNKILRKKIESQNENNKQAYKDFKKEFIDFFSIVQGEYGEVNIIENTSTYSGFILEYTTSFGLNIDLKRLEAKIINLGQTKEEKEYKNSEDSWIVSGFSGSDLIIEKNNKQYRIQAKNSFSEKDFTSIHLQSTVYLDTYAHTILDEQTANIFEYLILNRAYLSKYGLSGVKKGQFAYDLRSEKNSGSNAKNAYLTRENPNLEKYISYFLNLTLEYLIAGKIKSENFKTDNSNLFFIYKGQYLIPVSLFLYSAYELILYIQNNNNFVDDWKSSYGRLTFSKELDNLCINMNDARKLQREKFDFLNNPWLKTSWQQNENGYVNEKKYPEALIEIGQKMGKKLQKNAKFKKINFSFKIKEINKLLK